MKLLYFTDSHITFKTPASRIDDYQDAIYKKISEIIMFSNENNFDYIICGGDLFHSPTPTPNSVMIANAVARLLLRSKAKIYVVPGNHDIYSYNVETLDKSLLGIYAANDIVKILDRNNPLLIKFNDKLIAIEGQEYHIGIDKYNREDFTCNHKADFNILVSHAMVTSSVLTGYYKANNVNHIDLNDIETNADIVLTGHEHNGYSPKKIGNTLFMNPSSLARTDTSLKHSPKALIIELDKDLKAKVKEYKLKTAKPYDEIFNTEIKEEKKNKNKLLEQFKSEVTEISTKETSNIENIIDEIAKTEKIEKDIVDRAYSYIQEASEKDLSSKHINKLYKLCISEVELINFQSHKHTVVNLEDGLNAIVGSSDSGKTAIVRGILWCLYNTPKGNDFIRTGEINTSVKVSFSDGSYIKRSRDMKSSGSYVVCDSDGVLKDFEGFGSELPIEIQNEHQMPFIKLSKDKEANINISEQLDGPFLLGETSSLKANAVGKITNTDKVDLAIKELSTEIKSTQKETKIFSKQKEEKTIELEKYNDLDKDKALIDKLELLFEKYNKIEDEYNQLNEIKNHIDQLENELIILSDKLSKTIDITKIENKITYAKNILEEYLELNSYMTNVNNLEKLVNEHYNKIKLKIDFDKVENLTKKVIDEVNLLSTVLTDINKCAKLNTKMKTEHSNHTRNVDKIKEVDEKINYQLNLLNELVDKLGICPTCNTLLNEDNKNHIKGCENNVR